MIEQAILEILKANATVYALTGDRIEPGFLEQEDDATEAAEERQPTITYIEVTCNRPVSQSGDCGIVHAHYYLDCWAATRGRVKELATATMIALNGYRGTVTGAVVYGAFASGNGDAYLDSSKLWRYQVDLEIWGKED